MEPTAEESSLLDVLDEDEVTSEQNTVSLSFDEEDLLELDCKSESSNFESCLEKKSDFCKDELLQLDREYNQKYTDREKELLDNTPEDKPEQVVPPEKEEGVRRKIIKLNAPSKYNNIPSLPCGRESTGVMRSKKFGQHPYTRINQTAIGRPNYPRANYRQRPSLLLNANMQQPPLPQHRTVPQQLTASPSYISQPATTALYQTAVPQRNIAPTLFKATNRSSLFSKQSCLSQLSTQPVFSASEKSRSFSLSHLCQNSEFSVRCSSPNKSSQAAAAGNHTIMQTHTQSGRFSLSHLK